MARKSSILYLAYIRMNQLTINIAYLSDNQELINKMISDLKRTEVSFNLIDANSFVSGESFYSRLVEDNNPCLLVISDNFLKSQACLNQGLAYLQALIKKEQVLPIIIDGIKIDAAGNRQLIQTEFDKVSNVIKYMNFWQEKYLDLRKLKRSIPVEEEDEFARKLKIVRGISSEVGEYLRNLRDTDYIPFSEFSANHYEPFFRIFGDEASYARFVSANSIKEDNFREQSSSISAAIPVETFIEKEPEVIMEEPKIITEDSLNSEKLTTVKTLNKTAEPVSVSTATNNFLPFDDLITEKEKIENLSTEELSIVDANTTDKVAVNLEPLDTDEIVGEAIIEKIDDAQHKELTANDPEWELAEADATDLEVEAEPSLTNIAATEERSLTETELLALELSQKLPSSDSELLDLKFSDLKDNSVEEEMEEEEEMISLSDLMGDDFIEEAPAEVFSEEAPTNVVEEAPVAAINNINNVDLFTEVNGMENNVLNSEIAVDEEEELEGYFMDEGEETEEIIEELSEIDVLQSANILVQSGKVDAGISLLMHTLEEAPNFVSVRYQYAAFLAKYKNNFTLASDQLALLLEQEPHNLSAKFFLGELAEAERDYLTAKNYYEKVHHDNPEFPNVSYKLGMLIVNYLKDDPEAASDYLQEAYQFDSANINALYQFGLLQNESLQKEKEAITSFNEVLEKAPEHPFANYDLAVIYHKRGDKEKALHFYTKAAEVNPELKTAVNDQAFAIATEVVQARAMENLNIVELAESKEQQEDYTISNLVANVHSKQEISRVTNIQESNNPKVPKEAEVISTKEKEITGPIPSTKIALITGATSGIGKATATKFAKEGYQLILAGRRFSRLFQLKDQFENEFDAKVRLLPFDIKSSTAVQAALAELEEDWQAVDILINNAGLAKGEASIHEGEIANWEAMIDTNLKGLLYVTRQIAPYMVKRRKGHIINVCSLAGKEVYPNNAVYCATKHAVDALSKAMRIDLHKYNIRVSQVSPGYVEDTEFASVKTGESRAEITDFTPVNAQDVAEVIYFMATQPNHVTLQEVVMTGTQQASANIIDRSGRN